MDLDVRASAKARRLPKPPPRPAAHPRFQRPKVELIEKAGGCTESARWSGTGCIGRMGPSVQRLRVHGALLVRAARVRGMQAGEVCHALHPGVIAFLQQFDTVREAAGICRFPPSKSTVRRAWKPSAWAIALFLIWLGLLAVTIVRLFNLDALVPIAADVRLKPWMPIHPPIV
ncbi:hypothetical protein [Variovorax sp. YR216]|uniref:hypothetical protein n=1 Tax=Variovorax sp. YR216 TaxID=1882828 RepID=UPI0015A36CCD|nr:hypothetical protein [Variovorax sp. YR216]